MFLPGHAHADHEDVGVVGLEGGNSNPRASWEFRFEIASNLPILEQVEINELKS
jgi:hypothetical protein